MHTINKYNSDIWNEKYNEKLKFDGSIWNLYKVKRNIIMYILKTEVYVEFLINYRKLEIILD